MVLDSTDWQGDTSGLQKPAHIKRILFNGQVGIVPNITTDALDIVALFAAVVKMDADDTDTSIVLSSAGSIIQGSRVLWTECWSWGSMEITGGPLQHEYTSGPKLNIDLKPNLTVLPDERVLLILRFGSTVVETISAAAVSGYARCLIEQP